MAFRHDRRRRVLSEDASSGADAPDEADRAVRAAGDQEAYASAARRQQQPHIVDLVPLTWIGQSLILLAGLTVIAAMELAYLYAPELVRRLGPESATALDLAGSASLAHWFSTVLLCATAGLGMLVYRLRSHRLDDYRGRYRVWRWLVLAAILLSMHETAPLEPFFAAIARLASRWTGFENPRWWSLAVAAFWGLLTARTLFETRRSALASVALAIAAVALIGGPAIAGSLTPKLDAAQSVMLAGGLRLIGHLLLLSAVALYARHVILEAEGLVKSRARKARRGEKRRLKVKAAGDAEPVAASPSGSPAATRSAAGPIRADLPGGNASSQTRSPLAGRSDLADREPPRPHSSERRELDRDNDYERDSSGLTRAERKKLKRQQRQAS